jgi:hypothetical protein
LLEAWQYLIPQPTDPTSSPNDDLRISAVESKITQKETLVLRRRRRKRRRLFSLKLLSVQNKHVVIIL